MRYVRPDSITARNELLWLLDDRADPRGYTLLAMRYALVNCEFWGQQEKVLRSWDICQKKVQQMNACFRYAQTFVLWLALHNNHKHFFIAIGEKTTQSEMLLRKNPKKTCLDWRSECSKAGRILVATKYQIWISLYLICRNDRKNIGSRDCERSCQSIL